MPACRVDKNLTAGDAIAVTVDEQLEQGLAFDLGDSVPETQILDSIREMEESVSSGRAARKGLLRVNATPGFGRTRIAPLVSRFAHGHPDAEVELKRSGCTDGTTDSRSPGQIGSGGNPLALSTLS